VSLSARCNTSRSTPAVLCRDARSRTSGHADPHTEIRKKARAEPGVFQNTRERVHKVGLVRSNNLFQTHYEGQARHEVLRVVDSGASQDKFVRRCAVHFDPVVHADEQEWQFRAVPNFSKLTDSFCPHVSVAMTTGDSENADSGLAELCEPGNVSRFDCEPRLTVNSPVGIALANRLVEVSIVQRLHLTYETVDCFRGC
jgi:hypothetical protein